MIYFIVNADGSLDSICGLPYNYTKVGGCDLCDADALRLVKNMPNWIPAMRKGKKIACRFRLDVNFNIDY